MLPMPEDDPRRPALVKKAFKLSEKANALSNIHFERVSRRRGKKATKADKIRDRSDYVTFISTVRVRRDSIKNQRVSAIDSGSDSDSDDDEGKAPGDDLAFTQLRLRRRGRKPRRVMQSTVGV